jgi:hypothetical protein
MPVTDAQITALRAFLNHDPDTTVQLTARLGDDGIPGYWYLAEAALSIAACRRFSPRFTRADLVRYIASVRVSRMTDGAEYDLDPVAAENVLRYFLGATEMTLPDSETRLRTVISLLDALADTELSSDADADTLLAEACKLADRWVAKDQHRESPADPQASPQA